MTTENSVFKFLKDDLEKKISRFDSKRRSYRNKTYTIFIISIIFSVVTTIILGLNIQAWADGVRITALVLTTVATALNAYNTFSNNRDLWIANNTAKNKLLKISDDIKYLESKGTVLTVKQADSFKGQIQEAIDEMNSVWVKKKALPTDKT